MASTSVFQSAGAGVDQAFGGAFTADNVHLTWASASIPIGIAAVSGAEGGAMVQQVQFNVKRSINMLYEIGSTNVYYVGGRRQGQANFNRVVSGSTTFTNLAKTFGDICNPNDLTLNAKQTACNSTTTAGTVTGGGVTYTLVAATLDTVGASVSAQDIVINESLGFIFLDLGYA